ncbi:hypothetical protein Mgra_00003786 [Meloidogyne graminicola]|uniref:Uncharacterized protein n=1 Tax=Meloidogyne graminicola TaxID=189291 RepID=A0A8S9ZT18_9BILA|nr:hypothetical protein Mgra_00003786 [Meloidogyne graminicola]
MNLTLNHFVIISVLMVIICEFGVIAPPRRAGRNRRGRGQGQGRGLGRGFGQGVGIVTEAERQNLIAQLQNIAGQNLDYMQQHNIPRIIELLEHLPNNPISQNSRRILRAQEIIALYRTRQIYDLRSQIGNLSGQLAPHLGNLNIDVEEILQRIQQNPQNNPPNNQENQNQDQPPSNNDGDEDDQ